MKQGEKVRMKKDRTRRNRDEQDETGRKRKKLDQTDGIRIKQDQAGWNWMGQEGIELNRMEQD